MTTVNNFGVNDIPQYKIKENEELNNQIDAYLAAGGTIKVLPYAGPDKTELDDGSKYEITTR